MHRQIVGEMSGRGRGRRGPEGTVGNRGEPLLSSVQQPSPLFPVSDRHRKLPNVPFHRLTFLLCGTGDGAQAPPPDGWRRGRVPFGTQAGVQRRHADATGFHPAARGSKVTRRSATLHFYVIYPDPFFDFDLIFRCGKIFGQISQLQRADGCTD